MARLAAAGARVFRTDRHGDVSLLFSEGRIFPSRPFAGLPGGLPVSAPRGVLADRRRDGDGEVGPRRRSGAAARRRDHLRRRLHRLPRHRRRDRQADRRGTPRACRTTSSTSRTRPSRSARGSSPGSRGRLSREILSRGKLPILCGGTGFYVRAFFEGLFVGPPRDERAPGGPPKPPGAARGAPGSSGRSALIDPESGARISQRDGARAIRYLEIAFSTGRRPSDLFRERPGERWEGPSVKVAPHVAALRSSMEESNGGFESPS